jgi:hypothetical protein
VNKQQFEAEATFKFPASYAQQRMWLLDRLQPGTPIYNIPLALSIKGELDREALERSINQIILRHETLRTGFEERSGALLQVIAAEASVDLTVEEGRQRAGGGSG